MSMLVWLLRGWRRGSLMELAMQYQILFAHLEISVIFHSLTTKLLHKKRDKSFRVKVWVPSKCLSNCISKCDFTVRVSPGLALRVGDAQCFGVCAIMLHGTQRFMTTDLRGCM